MCEFYNDDDLRRIEKNSIHDLLLLMDKLRQPVRAPAGVCQSIAKDHE